MSARSTKLYEAIKVVVKEKLPNTSIKGVEWLDMCQELHMNVNERLERIKQDFLAGKQSPKWIDGFPLGRTEDGLMEAIRGVAELKFREFEPDPMRWLTISQNLFHGVLADCKYIKTREEDRVN